MPREAEPAARPAGDPGPDSRYPARAVDEAAADPGTDPAKSGDDTARLQALLRENQALFDAAMVGILVTRERVIRRCNDSLERMFGYARGELDGAPVRLLYASDADWERAGDAHGRALADQG